VGVVVLLTSLDSSVECSVLKLALDRLRNSLKFKNDGAITGMGIAVSCSQRPQPTCYKRDQSRCKGLRSPSGRKRKKAQSMPCERVSVNRVESKMAASCPGAVRRTA
jgi:hypothetical protein